MHDYISFFKDVQASFPILVSLLGMMKNISGWKFFALWIVLMSWVLKFGDIVIMLGHKLLG